MYCHHKCAGSLLFVQWVRVMTEWNDFLVHWSPFWTRRLREIIVVVHQLPPISRSFNLETAMECDDPPPPFFLLLWHIRFPLPQLLPSGGMACVVATCHSRISWGVLGFGNTFQFSHLFLRRFLFKPLVLFFCAYFCKILVFLCSLLWSFSLLWVLPLWFLRSSPPFLSFTSFFRYALLLFLFFASFFSALFPFLTLLFLFPFWWNLLILGTLPPQLPSFSLVWVRL